MYLWIPFPASQKKIMTNRRKRKLRKRERREICWLETVVREKSQFLVGADSVLCPGRPHGGSLEDCVYTPLMGSRMQ